MRGAPAVRLDRGLDQRWPDRAGQVVAAGTQCDRDAAPLFKPERDVGHQRHESRRRAEGADQQVGGGKRHQPTGQRGQREAGAKRTRADHDRQDDAATVGEPAHDDATHAEPDHRQRERQRGRPTLRPELGSDGGQGDHDGPHSDPADGRQQNSNRQAKPGVGGVNLASHPVFPQAVFSAVPSSRWFRPASRFVLSSSRFFLSSSSGFDPVTPARRWPSEKLSAGHPSGHRHPRIRSTAVWHGS
jgi:hypothetical protein